MISVGIDVSKEKSTVCILKPYGEVVSRPFEVCLDLCQYFGHKKLKVHADFFNSSSSFCWGVI